MLTSAERSSEVKAHDLRLPEGVVTKVVCLGQFLQVSFWPAITEVRDLCPEDCLREYEGCTSQRRP